MPDDLDVRLARLEERVANFTTFVDRHVEDEARLWDSVTRAQQGIHDRISTVQKTLSDRVTTLELWRAKLGGAAIAWSVVSGVVVALLTALILRITGA